MFELRKHRFLSPEVEVTPLSREPKSDLFLHLVVDDWQHQQALMWEKNVIPFTVIQGKKMQV